MEIKLMERKINEREYNLNELNNVDNFGVAYHQFLKDKSQYPMGTIFSEDRGKMFVDYPNDSEVIGARIEQLQMWLNKARELNAYDVTKELESIISSLTEKLNKVKDEALIGQN